MLKIVKKVVFNESIHWLKFKGGDANALGDIFQRYYQELYYYGLKIIPVPDIVKDVIQEMFVQFWDRRSTLGVVKNVKAYLIVSLRRELFNALKKSGSNLTDNDINTNVFFISVEDIIIKSEERAEFKERFVISFQKLSSRQREVIFLRFYNNLDFTELSEVLEMNVQSVRNLLFRSLEIIRKDLHDLNLYMIDDLEII